MSPNIETIGYESPKRKFQFPTSASTLTLGSGSLSDKPEPDEPVANISFTYIQPTERSIRPFNIQSDLPNISSPFFDLLDPELTGIIFFEETITTGSKTREHLFEYDMNRMWRGIFTPLIERETVLTKTIEFFPEQLPKLEPNIIIDNRSLRRLEEDE